MRHNKIREGITIDIRSFYKNKIYPNLYAIEQKIQRFPYHHYAEMHANDGRMKISDMRHPKIMEIYEGEFEYEYFNFCYLHNMLALMIYGFYHGSYPDICVNHGKKDVIQWEWYFKPLVSQKIKQSIKKVSCKKKTNAYLPAFKDIYSKKELHIWCQWYKKYVHLNQKTSQYVDAEYQHLFAGRNKVLGVICRGTDYLALKPSGHPVQPSTRKVIEICRKYMDYEGYDAIYLATEERKIRDAFEKAFPDKILENKRVYYDDIYDQDDSISYIKDVHFERKNDNYLSGLEYLSSIILLSRCAALVGGNCGGTLGALFFNDEKYEFVHVFNLGLYP